MAATGKWKAAERIVARKLQEAVGKVTDKTLRNLVTSTGRIGHLTELGVDAIMGEDDTALIVEVKRRYLPVWFKEALYQIVARGFEYERVPIFAFQLADDAEKFVVTKVGRKRMVRTWVAAPIEFYEKLLKFYVDNGGNDGSK